ncbi:hypothetical protein MKW94_002990 [Papaver nudicaule]|uniref:cytokinin dehydrogenase n=1 Tax=Papaver nudicaule TaxID=74823 RepID=A0AA41S7Q1_PAPNU|nr:hypothetical protein [Papaver nudicaule]
MQGKIRNLFFSSGYFVYKYHLILSSSSSIFYQISLSSLALSLVSLSLAKSMTKNCSSIQTYLKVILVIVSRVMSIFGKPTPSTKAMTNSLPQNLLSLDLANRLSFNSDSINVASTDFGKLVQSKPQAVLYPSSHQDIQNLVKSSYTSTTPFSIAAKGRGHSVRGQAMAQNGVVIEMRSLMNCGNRINVSSTDLYADVGGEQLWIDVLNATLESGLTPKSWTDYLYLTVGGTLSNAGISGQSFLYGPQINNVYEMDIITGRGETVTCSKHMNSELFFGVMGGLGQFGIITRARIALQPAPQKVKWVRMLYNDFSVFTRDQEHLISKNIDDNGQNHGLDYVEGSLMMGIRLSSLNNWRSSSFYSKRDYRKIISLATTNDGKTNIIYCLEVAKYYDDLTANTIDKELEMLFSGLSYTPGFKFTKDVSYVDFLNRVRIGELELQKQGLWDVPHPWLNLFIPKSRISEFDSGVFQGILRKYRSSGPVLVYPTHRNKWDERASAVVPDEEIFYSVGLLQSSGMNDWEYFEEQNKEIIRFCEKVGIKFKQYLPHYETKTEWENHFGAKWDLFQQRKTMFDPKRILSPGQRIFSS